MQVFFGIAYFLIGIFQLFAAIDGIKLAFGVSSFVSVVIAFFVTYIPLVGSAFGVYGAHYVWDWGLIPAILLFFWYVPVYLVLAVGSAIFDR